MTSTCNSLNSFDNKGIYCKAMSGNAYNTAEETGPGDRDRRMDVLPDVMFDPLLFPLLS